MKKIACTLLVDDNDNTNFLHQMVLEDMDIGGEILVATNGMEAIELIQKRLATGQASPDLMLLDINMPVMDGFEFMAAFKELEFEDHQPLIIAMLTIALKTEDVKELQHSTAVEFLKKPLIEQSLREVLKKHSLR